MFSAVLLAAVLTAPPTLYTNAHLIPVTGAEIPVGDMLVADGMIVDLGTAGTLVDSTQGLVVVDCMDRVIMPGLICTHSHIGGWGGGDRSGPIQPETRIFDAINVSDPGFRRAVAGGLTALNIMPGSGHLSSGQTTYVKLRPARTVDDILILDDNGQPMGGLKMANGTNPQGGPGFPGTRGKSAALVRQAFLDAQHYAAQIEAAGDDPAKLPKRDLRLETLAQVLDGSRTVHHHTHRHDDIMTVLRLAEEFNFNVVLHHVSDGWKVADEIAAAGAPCSIIVVDSPGGKEEALDISFRTGKILADAGVTIAYHTDDFITDSRYFLRSPAMGIRAGLDRDTALRSVTLNAAAMLDIDHRTGSLEPGKDADFIVLDGDPFSIWTKVLATHVEGEQVFDRTDPDDLLVAQGGWGVGTPGRPYMCCQEHFYSGTESGGAH
ncbi:MAG: amidohydrolase family protein [Phycisphaerales bacterium]|nr:amidohydrolase family protein [Phycisphaerales bacterium]